MKRYSIIAVVLVLAAFGYGLVRLFNLRFETGDVYPPYSSFRADPLGTKALHESLGQLVDTSRHVERWSRLGDGSGATLLYLGASPEQLLFRKDEIEQLERFVASGGRLVIGFVTRYKERTPLKPVERDTKIDAADRWDFESRYVTLSKDEEGAYLHPIARNLTEGSSLPSALSWHSAMYFTNLAETWEPIYAISNDLPVLIERPLGAGTIVLSSDSYLFSNEALLTERHSALLTWMVGSARRVIFDETHLGVREEPGIATLARRYRLHGLAAALLGLALLYIWRSTAPFLPPADGVEAGTETTIAGKESAAGFVNLLRRNIQPSELAAVCISEWKRTCAHRVAPARLQRIQEIIDRENALPPAQREPVRIYQEISSILAIRKPRGAR